MMSSFKTDLGKRAIDEDDFEKRAFGFKSDLGKRDETIDGDDEYSKRAYGFRSDLGKRAYGFRSDLGKRAYGFRSDLGKRAYGFRSDLGKRGYGFRADLGKRTIDTSLDDLDTNTLQHLLEGNDNFKRAYGFRSDLGKRDQDKRGYGFRSDLGKRFYDALGSSDQLDRYSDDADRAVIDSHSHELSGDSGKRGYGFRADLGKRYLNFYDREPFLHKRSNSNALMSQLLIRELRRNIVYLLKQNSNKRSYVRSSAANKYLFSYRTDLGK